MVLKDIMFKPPLGESPKTDILKEDIIKWVNVKWQFIFSVNSNVSNDVEEVIYRSVSTPTVVNTDTPVEALDEVLERLERFYAFE